MAKILFTITVLFFSLSVYAQKNKLLIANSNNCIKRWIVNETQDTIKATVEYYYEAPWDCGVFATAAVIIARTDKNQFYRVIDLCNTDTIIKPLDKILIIPSKAPTFSFSISFQKTYKECEIRNTYFGEAIKVD
jgi:hypothetical protein